MNFLFRCLWNLSASLRLDHKMLTQKLQAKLAERHMHPAKEKREPD